MAEPARPLETHSMSVKCRFCSARRALTFDVAAGHPTPPLADLLRGSGWEAQRGPGLGAAVAVCPDHVVNEEER